MISKQVSTVELFVAFIWEIRKKTEIMFEANPVFLFSSSMYYFRFPSVARDVSLLQKHPGRLGSRSILVVTGPFSPGLKRPGREAVLSPPCNS